MSAFQLRDYQVNCSNQVFETWKTHKSVLISLPTGAGKCLGNGTPVLMFDGTIRRVEDVMVGELLMGPDSLHREVLSTCSGWEEMFRVTPVKGEPYTVNKSHILSLKITGLPAKSTGSGGGLCTGMIVNVNVADYLQRSKSFKHIAKGYRVGVDFSPKPCSLPPYFLGLWLGDGTSSRPEITTPDQEVKDYIKSLCETEGLRFVEKAQKDNLSSVCSLSGPITGRSKNKRNRILEELRVLGLVGNKHIPAIYKHNSREVRLEILAGLMDSDGHQHNGGFDYTSIRELLSNDVAYLARSLGLAAYVSRCRKVCSNNGAVGTYFRVSVSGDCSQIPVRIPRKKATARKQKKDVLMTGIKSCESVGNGQYFGFTITGDGLFLLGDFTVTHNTIIFADVIKRLQPKRSLVVAHREELIRQAQQKIENTTGLECGIEMANERVSSHPRISGFGLPVIIATVQTLNAQFGDRKRMGKFDPMDFGCLIIDECHRSTARSYRNVINYFQQNPDLRVLGCSATPVRHDKEALSQVFGSVAYDYSILDGIKDGWLCDITQQFSTVAGLDYSHIRTTADDLNGADLAAVMEAESNIVGVCQPSLEVLFGIPPHTLDQTPVPQWGEYLRGLNRPARRAIVFAASVLQAELCCNIFNRVIPGMSDWVCGETNKEKRKKILDDFASGALRVVMNCAVLTEGYDNPFVEVVIMAHPTKSAGRYQQMVGRSCRPLPGVVDHPDLNTPEQRVAAIAASLKPFCRIVDFIGNSGKHRLVSCMDILGGKVSDDARQFAINKATKEGKPVRVSRVLDKAEIQLQEEKQKQAEERRRQEAARKAHLVARSKFSMQDVDAFGKFGSHNATPMRDGHRQRPPTEKMARLLRRNGVNPDKLNFAQAGAIIGKWIAQWKGNNGNGKKK